MPNPSNAASTVSQERIHPLNAAPFRRSGRFVLYWMTAARRTRHNPALDHAIQLARELGKPLVVLEALRVAYPWASDRIHHAILSGMRDNQAAFRKAGIPYLSFVEEQAGQGKGLVAALAQDACCVVTDLAPVLFIPDMARAAGAKISCRMVGVDGWGLMPLAGGKAFTTAMAFRRHVQATAPTELDRLPATDPLSGLDLLPADVAMPDGWPDATPRLGTLRTDDLPIRHDVAPVAGWESGPRAAAKRLERFLARLDRYDEERNHPDRDATSGLSSDFHFGHLASTEVVAAILAQEQWSPDRFVAKPTGKRGGWGVSASAEGFLDQVVTWRELGAMEAWHNPLWNRYEGLPTWARATLELHSGEGGESYTLEQLRRAETDDDIWNVAQKQLLREGRIHNYLRMLWGKRILEWAPSPQDAFQWMLELNDTYALDGRDPNSVSGIAWVMGRYDHPWPERKSFGTVRCMTSASTRRKLDLEQTLARFS